MEAHPNNVAGDFYVENGCCTACDVPISQAPDLFQYDAAKHCFVSRQPATEKELSQMLNTVMCAELGCVRYRGRDPKIYDRLGAIGSPEVCDFPPANGIKVAIRNHATFRFQPDSTVKKSAKNILDLYKYYLINSQPAWINYRFRPIVQEGNTATIGVSWFEDHFHDVSCTASESADYDFLVRHYNDQWPLRCLCEWLQGSPDVTDLRWYTRTSWERGGWWHRTAW